MMPRSLSILLVCLVLACSSRGRPESGNAAPSSRGTTAQRNSKTHTPLPDRLPQTHCLGRSGVPLEKLVDEAATAFEAGAYERTLLCAGEALHIDPRYVPAIHYRAAALAALDRFDEARNAFALALAVDPDDPETLLSAGDFFVIRLGDRESLQIGLEHALRGARQAQIQPELDRELVGRLYLLAGMAENDLGQSAMALEHLDRALARLPNDTDALYERGVALYELCRFAEAQRAFEAVLRRLPNDAWTIHYLGLVAERIGEPRARSLMARAVRLAPGKIQPEVELPPGGFEEELQRSLAALSDADKKAVAKVPVQFEDLPALADLTAVNPPLSPSILGLFRGPSENEPCTPTDGTPCRSIVLYRKNLARFARDRRELSEQIRTTLLHEIGHLHGEDDDELRDRGLE